MACTLAAQFLAKQKVNFSQVYLSVIVAVLKRIYVEYT